MSLIPILFSDWWDDIEHPHRLTDQHFGLGINPAQLLNPSILDHFAGANRANRSPMLYYRPWGELLRNKEQGGISTMKLDEDKFQMILDVQQFKPSEINVKVVDRCIVIEAKHEEKRDEHGWISRQFIRKYLVPEQCDIEQVTSSLSSDGVLIISVPKKDKAEGQNERAIKIEQTGKPMIRNKTPQEKEKEEKQAT